MRTFYYIILILTLVSCKKEEPQDSLTTYLDLDKTLKNNYSFNEGSYWVYQDQAMNRDSIVLLNKETGYTKCSGYGCIVHEYIKLNFKNITQGFTYNHYLFAKSISYNGGGDYGMLGQPIYLSETYETYEFNGITVGQIFDNLIILNQTFHNVKQMKLNASNQYQHEFDNNVDFYFCPTIGIVKYVVFDTINGTKTWELKNYHLQ